jgi:very-short-patch-repair endonuclease
MVGNSELFFKRCFEKHGDRYDYSETVFECANTKVEIRCREHGLFKQLARSHTSGNGCSRCGKPTKPNVFFKKCLEKHGDRYDYSQTVYVDVKTKVKIICREHGIFEQSPAHHANGSGCSRCTLATGDKKLFFKKCLEQHGERYDYSETGYVNSGVKVKIRCREHGVFEQIAGAHARGRGCRECLKAGYLKSFFQRCHETHGDRYDYSHAIFNTVNHKIQIVCREHGIFTQMASAHIKGAGCLSCARILKTTEQFIEEANIFHSNKYDYSQTVYVACDIKCKIICPDHGLFEQSPDLHLRSYGCQRCGMDKRAKSSTNNTEYFIKKATAIHGDRYDYSKSNYITNRNLITIGCKIHVFFQQKSEKHMAGQGCSKCQHFISKPEIKFLNLIGIPEEDRQYKIGRYRCDGYDRNTNTVYELDGDYYHGNPAIYDQSKVNAVTKKTFGEHYRRTTKKRDFILAAGFNIVSVWESELKEFTEEWIKHYPI